MYGAFNESEEHPAPSMPHAPPGAGLSDAFLTNLINLSSKTPFGQSKPQTVVGEVDMLVDDESEDKKPKQRKPQGNVPQQQYQQPQYQQQQMYQQPAQQQQQTYYQPLQQQQQQNYQFSQPSLFPTTQIFAQPYVQQPVQPQAPQAQPFEIVNEKYYVQVDYLLQNKRDALQKCESLVNNAQPPMQKAPAQPAMYQQQRPVAQPIQQQNMFQLPPQPQGGNGTGEDSMSCSFHIEKRTRKENAFRWTPERHVRFAIVCMALGVRDCKPKHVMTFYENLGIDRAVVSSHLQKLRNSIIKQYGLQTLDQVENTMAPKDIDDERLRYIVQRWHEPGFSGFTSQQVHEFIRGM
ncbi:Conserved_hypothetical protein [Hexamita inflata]|uniref:Uncharacterized protein n=1 Tax=Hexamita inflata TaxID=28002 RepID=A0AA86V4H2_9EUKA|nr:Conserved hypothetical protein [Hexamita inflata]